jgi:hypothetical protein
LAEQRAVAECIEHGLRDIARAKNGFSMLNKLAERVRKSGIPMELTSDGSPTHRAYQSR